MILKDIRIKRPLKDTQIQGKYVYYVRGSEYKKDRKYNVDDRKAIGKMIDDEYMNPNEAFFDFFPDTEKEFLKGGDFSDTLKAGAIALISKILKDKGLDSLLDEVFIDSGTLKDLISYMLIDENISIQHFPDFMYDHISFKGKIVSDSYISSLFKNEITNDDIDTFNMAWANLNNDKTKVYISYDSVNMNAMAKGIELANKGHAKKDKRKPQVNISYGVRSKDSLPLFYDMYDGNIVNVSECRYMVKKADEFGFKDIGFILDKGYFSKANMDEILDKGYDLILMVKDNLDFVTDLIDKKGISLKMNNRYYLVEHEVYGLTEKIELYDRKMYLHLYYDNIRAQKERNDFLKEIDHQSKRLDQKIAKKTLRKEDIKGYDRYFSLRFDQFGFFESYRIKERAIQKTTDSFAYFAIITSQKMEADKALTIYRDRDVSEKMCRRIKTSLDYDTFRVYDDTSLKAKTLIVFIASIIRSIIYQGLKPLYKKDRKNYTVISSIKELEKIEVTKNNHGTYRRKYALTAEAKNILEAFDINEKQLDNITRSLIEKI